MNPFFEINLQSIAPGGRGAAQSLYRQIRAAIVSGRLAAGSKLPATRQAMSVFKVSRNTVAKAYDMLVGEGLITARRGSGTYIAHLTPASRLRGLMRGSTASDARLNPFWRRQEVADALGFWSERSVEEPARRSPLGLDFRPGIVDPRLFPMDIFRKLSGEA